MSGYVDALVLLGAGVLEYGSQFLRVFYCLLVRHLLFVPYQIDLVADNR